MGVCITLTEGMDVIKNDQGYTYFLCRICALEIKKEEKVFRGLHDAVFHIAASHGMKFTDDCKEGLFFKK